MGNKNQKYKILQLQTDNWQKLRQTPFYDLMRERLTGLQGNYYHFIMPENQNLEQQLDTYLYRSSTLDNIVKVIGVESHEQGFGFCGSQRLVRVMTEKIVANLSDIRNLTDRNQLNVLFHALKGYNCIKGKMGPMKISANLIGINQKGETKVWVNQNYSLNAITEDHQFKHQQQQQQIQQQMIQNLVTIVERSSTNHLPTQLKNALIRTNSLTKALEIIASHVKDKSIFHNEINIENINHQEEEMKKKQLQQNHHQVPPVRYAPQSPSNIHVLHPGPFISNSQLNYRIKKSEETKPIGPFPLQMKITPEQTKSRFILLSGKQGQSSIDRQKGQQKRQNKVSEFVSNNKSPSNKVKFSYDKRDK